MKRNQAIPKDTWDLTTIFKDHSEWQEAFEYIQATHPKASEYQGKMASSANMLLEALKFQEQLFELLSKVYVYAHLSFDVDTTDPQTQGDQANVMGLYGQVMSSFAYVSSELLDGEQKIQEYLKQDKLSLYRHDFEQLFKKRQHILSEAEERILAQASEVLESSEQTFGMLNNADMKFPKVSNDQQEEVQLSHSLYGVLLESKERKVREGAFRAMYASYDALIHTFASTLSGKIKTDNFYARVKNYPNARASALARNDIPEAVYDNLIAQVHASLPLLHDYIQLRKDVLGLKQLAMYDLYTPLVDDVDMKFSFEEAKQIALEALLPLGEDYQELLHKAFDSRWIDVYENQGKRSGAYSSGTYGTNPFILLNWQDNLDNVFTLVHELGHSMHSYYTRSNQPFVYGDYSIFVAEIASTTNENLLTDYLLKKYQDPKIKAYVLNHYLDGVKGTIFRQTQFAEFELFMHTTQQEGNALTASYLSEAYLDLNKVYYGNDMVYDKEIAIEWARIPHFYYNYYVYQYATGFAAASALSHKILTGTSEDLDAYKTYLKAGCSDYPLNVMKKAGVDMTNPRFIQDTMDIFGKRLKELRTLLVK